MPVSTVDCWSTYQCDMAGGLHVLDSCWLGALFQHDHRVLFSFQKSKQHFVAMKLFSDSAVMCWPASLQSIPRVAAVKHIVLDSNTTKPTLVTIYDLDDIVTWHFSFKAYSSVWTDHQPCRNFLVAGLLLIDLFSIHSLAYSFSGFLTCDPSHLLIFSLTYLYSLTPLLTLFYLLTWQLTYLLTCHHHDYHIVAIH